MVELDRVVRPGAVVGERALRLITEWLTLQSVERGGIWLTTSTVWQRFDRPWNAVTGMRDGAQKIGSIYVVYDQPTRYHATIHRIQLSPYATMAQFGQNWTVDKLADEVLRMGDLTLETCPRDVTLSGVGTDPFRRAWTAQAGRTEVR